MRFRAALIALGLAALLASAPAAWSADTGSARSLALEREGHLAAALAVLDPLPLKGAPAEHRVALRDAVATLAAARIYRKRKQLDVEQSVLVELTKRLDAVRDVYVYAAVQEQLAEVNAKLAPPRERKPDFFDKLWQDVKDAGETVLKWLILLAGVVLLFLVVRWIAKLIRSRRRARKGLGVALEDLSVEQAQQARGSRTLGGELRVALMAASQSADAHPRPTLDAAKDLDGGAPLNVKVAGDELAALDPYFEDGSPVKVGPLSVTPRQLFSFIAATFRPRYEYEFTGYLTTSGTATLLAVELRDGDGNCVRWSGAEDGQTGRASVIREAARRILFETGKERISESWPSVAAYREAREKLAAIDGSTERSVALGEVRRLLERSLSYDPVNRFARFELGTVLRKLGENEDALAQYDFIDRLAPLPDETGKELRRTLHYNRAIALSKVGRWEEYKRALALMDELCAQVKGDAGLPDERREEMQLIIRSCWAAIKVFEAERYRSEHDRNKTRERTKAVLADVKRQRDWIDTSPKRCPNADVNTYVQARAVAENALGRVAYLDGRPAEEAIASFSTALSLVPELGDAHVNMASVLLRAHAHYGDWAGRVERHITRALEISPRDRKALYLRGRLYTRLGEPDDARKAFAAAAEAGDDWALLRLGEFEWADGKRKEAVALAQRSLARGRAYDRRAELFVQWTATLAEQGAVERATLVAAREAGNDLERNAKKRDKKLSESARKAIATIDAKLARAAPDDAYGDDQLDD
jgi:tetratricopeptide (TPR) repeat protein